jgi:hypothetical protein
MDAARATAASTRSAAAEAPRSPTAARTQSAPTRPGVLRGGADGASAVRGETDPDAAVSEPPGVTSTVDEPLAARDIGRLLRYGERIGGDKIDVRMLPLQLHARSGALAVCDPARPETWRVLDRPIGNGAFRVMLSIARPDDATAGGRERLAAAVIHVGRPPIAKWTVAQFRGEPRAAASDAIARTIITDGWLALVDASDGSPGVIALPPASGIVPIEVPLTDGRRALALPCGNGSFAIYWAIDAADKPICVVIDFDAFTPKAWKAKPVGQP